MTRGTPRSFVFLALICLLSLGSASQATPALAAPPAQETVTNMRFYLNISYPTTFCAGREYSIGVTPLVELNGKRSDGEKFNYQDRIIPGVEITAEITATNIATINPARPQSKKSGYLPGDLLGTSSLEMQERLGNLGEVVFKLKAKKSGATNLILMAKVPGQWSGGRDRYFGPQGMPAGGPIKVVDCEYQVTMTYRRQDPFGVATGFMPGTLVKSDGQGLKGQGQFTFHEFASLPTCTLTTSELKSPTGITARIVDPNASPLTLRLSFDYSEATKTIYGRCIMGRLGVATSQETVPEDPDWFLDLPEVYFKEPWGTRKFPTFNGGSMWITVKPVLSSATK